jgi:hypothetical protein
MKKRGSRWKAKMRKTPVEVAAERRLLFLKRIDCTTVMQQLSQLLGHVH